MISSSEHASWSQRSHLTKTAAAEETLLTDILKAESNQIRALTQLCLAKDCPSLFRCAALDRYLILMEKQTDSAWMLLDRLVLSQFEPNEDVRFVGYQWLAHLKLSQAVHNSAQRGVLDPDLKQRLEHDPSPRIRQLAWLR